MNYVSAALQDAPARLLQLVGSRSRKQTRRRVSRLRISAICTKSARRCTSAKQVTCAMLLNIKPMMPLSKNGAAAIRRLMTRAAAPDADNRLMTVKSSSGRTAPLCTMHMVACALMASVNRPAPFRR